MSEHPHRYTIELATDIEPAWQRRWADEGVHKEPNPGEPGFDASRPKFYCLDMFPYPSGSGLHVGHPEGYTATDIVSRYKRMTGHRVLHPMGWDAFGLPAENHAIRTGEHPATFTRTTIETFRAQLQRFGFSYDWSREFATIDEGYYHWTQWIFLRLYNSWFDADKQRARPIDELEHAFATGARPVSYNPHGAEVARDLKQHALPAWDTLDAGTRHAVLASWRLAYLSEQTVNWCPALGTALANEEVIDGRSERGAHPVFRKPMRQWMLRITAYAERLLDGLHDLHWPDSTKTQQTEWIGRSTGVEIDFALADAPEAFTEPLRVFTTRPDTIFGATFMVVAPEHPLVDAVLRDTEPRPGTDALRRYADEARNRSDVERQESKDKTGVPVGVSAVNPATGDRIPVWAADYVLMGYGSGAIMAVPAHDQRDFEFAEKFDLDIVDVIYPIHLCAAAEYAAATADPDRVDDHWKQLLADTMALAATGTYSPGQMDAVIERVRWGRGGRESIPETRVDSARGANERSEAGGVGSMRGVISGEWLEQVEDMGFVRIEELWACFAAGGFYKRTGSAYPGSGYAVNSANSEVSLDGLSRDDAKAAIIAWLERKRLGRATVHHRLRDWLFSRQRYWGEPFPIVFDSEGRHHAVSDEALPVVLPALTDYEPVESDDPAPLLNKATDWVRTTAGAAGIANAKTGLATDAPVTRETNTMPGWAGSCWYHLRYCDPSNPTLPIGKGADDAWLGEAGVDLYIGGAEHAVLHLLYARFWHMLLFDLGVVKSAEPYRRLFHQGLITSYAYKDAAGRLTPIDEVRPADDGREGAFVHIETGAPVTQIVAKMSKSLKNVVNPDEVIAEYGADTFRLYEMYMGPLEQSKPWNTKDTVGLFRFLQKLWRLCINEQTGEPLATQTPDAEIEKRLHRMIDKVGSDIDSLGFNAAIAAMIEFVNAAGSKTDGGTTPSLTAGQIDRVARTLSPFAPHAAEEIWERLGRRRERGPLAHQPWPEVDQALLVDDEDEVAVQLRGKVKAKIMVPAGVDAKGLEAFALAHAEVQSMLAGMTVRKIIAVPGRLVNIVAD